jgi:hypothetical protein
MSKITVNKSELFKIIDQLEKANDNFGGIGDGNWHCFVEEEIQLFSEAEILLGKNISRLKKMSGCQKD